MSLGVSFNLKTGQVHLGGLLEVVVRVNHRCGVVPALGRAKKETSP